MKIMQRENGDEAGVGIKSEARSYKDVWTLLRPFDSILKQEMLSKITYYIKQTIMQDCGGPSPILTCFCGRE